MALPKINAKQRFGQFFGRTVSEGAAYAAGLATGPVLRPITRAVESEIWQLHQDKPLDPGDVAKIVAEDVLQAPWGRHEAANNGIGPDRFDALTNEARNAPDLGTLYTLWRRGEIGPAQFVHGLRKAKLEGMWDGALQAIKDRRLDPAVIAVAIQRGIMRAPFALPVEPATGGGKVPAFPTSPLDAAAEAEAAGIDVERLFVETAIVGNPASPDLAARLSFRNIIDKEDYYRAISEGNTRNEWRDPLYEGFRQINTAHDWVELHLRGYIAADAMYAGTALHGMSREDTDRLFQVLGRPLPVHQITTALARGAKFHPIPGELTDPYEASVHESNIKPSYYEMAIANKYSYPSLFQLNNLVKAKAIDAPTAEDWAHKQGLAPEVVTAMGVYWRSLTGASGGTSTKTATSSAVRAIQKAYVQGNTSRAEATAELVKLGEDASTFPALFTAWDVSKAAYLQGLTNVQIRNRYRSQALTEAEAVALLTDRGLDAATATAYLNG